MNEERITHTIGSRVDNKNGLNNQSQLNHLSGVVAQIEEYFKRILSQMRRTEKNN